MFTRQWLVLQTSSERGLYFIYRGELASAYAGNPRNLKHSYPQPLNPEGRINTSTLKDADGRKA